MRRRDFIVAGVAASALAAVNLRAGTYTSLGWNIGEAKQQQRLLFFDSSLLADQSQVQLVPAKLEKVGTVMVGDSPGDGGGVSTQHGGSMFRDERGVLRLYYTGISKNGPKIWLARAGICIAESDDGLKWRKPRLGQVQIDGKDSNRLLIPGLPEGSVVVQPVVLRLADGRWRMYFWVHRLAPPEIARYIVAESRDGLHWHVLNYNNPCLRHPADIGRWAWLPGPEARKASGDIPLKEYLEDQRLRTNDEAIVYPLQESYELFNDGLVPNPPDSGHYVPYDNIAGSFRVIERRSSEDGLVWSSPELILVPDRLDPWDLQFYYLAQHRLGPWRLGFLGYYRVAFGTMDVEFIHSRDGRLWERPLRGPWFPRGPAGSPDSEMVYMPGPFIDKGDHWLSLYTGCNFLHGRSGTWTVLGIQIPKYRFAGLRASDGLPGRFRTRPFVPWGPKLLLDAEIRGELRAELCDVFGRPLSGFSLQESVPITGDCKSHDIQWKNAAMSDYQFDGISLRLEWTDGTVYGLLAS
jgi:hypothetical protein